MIEITDSASRIIARQLEKQHKGGGGSGFSYTFAWDDSAKDSDQIFEGTNGAKVFVDARSLKLLDGTVLDFDEHNLLATSFTLKNPHAKSTCGCGESFSA